MKYSNLLTIVFLTTVFIVFPSVVRAEHIESFVSDISIAKDSTAVVTERIAYVFTEERHGIFRCVPTIHQDKASSVFKERYIDVEIKSVRMDSQDAPYTLNETSGELCVKIGDADTLINGPHTYEIVYTVGGAVSYEAYGGAEWYWNVSGNAWEIPVYVVEAHVSSVDSILLRERACYRGVVGKTDSCQIATDTEGKIIFSGTQFNPGEGMTIAQALDRSKIAYDVRERYNLAWLIAIFSIFVVGVSAYALYRYKTKFRTGNTIIPQYEPYPEVKPMYAGYLFDKRLDARDITAGVVYLAEQGFIKIKKIDKKVLFFFEVDDYEMELIRPIQDLIGTFEKEIIEFIFDTSAQVGGKMTLSDLKSNYSKANENRVRLLALDRALAHDVTEKGFFTGFFFTRRTRKGYVALDHLKGFKDFLRVTETQRYIFHNAPEKNAEQFMEYLPYAIAFGVEKEWAKTFEGITITNPDWYDGGGNMSTFNAVALTQSLGGFSTAFAASSGTSASSGGGSSGGGGGGGGGGSW
ncbi:MAG: DUF2207 domain-containing protein [Minisyncoccia bacterium]